MLNTGEEGDGGRRRVHRGQSDQPSQGKLDKTYAQISSILHMQVGEGMSSYMAYTVTTSTNLSYFKKKNPAVNRRFSDFLGLRDKLAEKYLQNGRIIPPAPDKYV